MRKKGVRGMEKLASEAFLLSRLSKFWPGLVGAFDMSIAMNQLACELIC
jgi:hypothetical protein